MTEVTLKIVVHTDDEQRLKMVKSVLEEAASSVGTIAINSKNVAVEIKLDTSTSFPFRQLAVDKTADAVGQPG